MPERIALFGGTFDPVHLGHMAMAHAAREALDLDRVVMIPCAISPHKTDGPLPASGACRLDMLRVACGEQSWMEVDVCELEREGESFSWQTAQEFRERFPAARLFWILGQDQWMALPRWTHPERLGALVEFIVFGRNHRRPVTRDGFTAMFLPEVHDASATRIRDELAGDQSADGSHPWIDPAVMGYIREHGLYGAGQ